MTLEQLNAGPRTQCEQCPHAEAIRAGSVDCKKKPRRVVLGIRNGPIVPFVNGKCPISLWDNTNAIPAPEANRRPDGTRPGEYRLCIERLREEWDAGWQARILAAVIRTVGRCHFIPADLYETAKKHRGAQHAKARPPTDRPRHQ